MKTGRAFSLKFFILVFLGMVGLSSIKAAEQANAPREKKTLVLERLREMESFLDVSSRQNTALAQEHCLIITRFLFSLVDLANVEVFTRLLDRFERHVALVNIIHPDTQESLLDRAQRHALMVEHQAGGDYYTNITRIIHVLQLSVEERQALNQQTRDRLGEQARLRQEEQHEAVLREIQEDIPVQLPTQELLEAATRSDEGVAEASEEEENLFREEFPVLPIASFPLSVLLFVFSLIVDSN